MDDVWVAAIAAVAIGLMAGLAGAGLLYRALLARRPDDPVYRDSARSMAISCFIFFTAVGVLIAISVVNRDSFEDVPSRLVDELPAFLAAGLILVGGRAIALAAGSVTQQSLQASSPRVRDQAARLVRWTITAAAIVIALAQIGVNTTLLHCVFGALWPPSCRHSAKNAVFGAKNAVFGAFWRRNFSGVALRAAPVEPPGGARWRRGASLVPRTRKTARSAQNLRADARRVWRHTGARPRENRAIPRPSALGSAELRPKKLLYTSL
jgi:hypothetical protein